MRRTTLVLASFGLLLGGSGTLLFAGDPPVAPSPAAPAADAARIQQLVEDLASADFRVREAAWKALVEYGEKARPALESAVKSDNPAVRFRAEQLLARLNGGTRERPLDDGTTPAPAPKPGGGVRPGLAPAGPGRFFTDEDFERLMRETQERMRKLEEELRREFGNGGPTFGPGWFGPGPQRLVPFLGGRRAAGDLRLDVDGASLRESARGARLELKEKADNGTTMSTVFEGKTFDAILEAHPELKERAPVKALVEKRTAELAARAEREKAESANNPSGGFTAAGKSVIVSSQDGKTTVTITETGPDGKSTTKTYEGPDLETIRREHPEIADSIGGVRIEIGPGHGMRPLPLPPRTDAAPGEDDDADGFGAPETGPFGLSLAPVGDLLASHLGLEAGKGAVVVAIRDGSDAAKLGLQKNDVITAVNGAAFASLAQVAELIRAAKDGALAIDVLRAGKPVTLKR